MRQIGKGKSLGSTIPVIWELIKQHLDDRAVTSLAAVSRAFRKKHQRRRMRVPVDQWAFDRAFRTRPDPYCLVIDGQARQPSDGWDVVQSRQTRRKKKELERTNDLRCLGFHPHVRATLFDVSALYQCRSLRHLIVPKQAYHIHVTALKVLISLKQLERLELQLYDWTVRKLELANLAALVNLRDLNLSFDEHALEPEVFAAICSLPVLRRLELNFGWMKNTNAAWREHAPRLHLWSFKFWLMPDNTTDACELLPIYFGDSLRVFETGFDVFDLSTCVKLEHVVMKNNAGPLPWLPELRSLSASIHCVADGRFPPLLRELSLCSEGTEHTLPPDFVFVADTLESLSLQNVDVTPACFAKLPSLKLLQLKDCHGLSSPADLAALRTRFVVDATETTEWFFSISRPANFEQKQGRDDD